jgi:predicted esterase
MLNRLIRFDIYSLDFRSESVENLKEDDPGILSTSYKLNKLITDEVDLGIPANRIVLGGFSQGV